METTNLLTENLTELLTALGALIIAIMQLSIKIANTKNSKEAKKNAEEAKARGEIIMKKIESNDKKQDEKINHISEGFNNLTEKVNKLHEESVSKTFAKDIEDAVNYTIQSVKDTNGIQESNKLCDYFDKGEETIAYLAKYVLERGILNGRKFNFEAFKRRTKSRLKDIRATMSTNKLGVEENYMADLTHLTELRINSLVVELKKYRCENNRPSDEYLIQLFCDFAENVTTDAIITQDALAKKTA
jgi:formyltetrahydrofolate synthetase